MPSQVLEGAGTARRVFLARDALLLISDRYGTHELGVAGGQPGQAAQPIQRTLAAKGDAVAPVAVGEPLRVNGGVWELRLLDGGRRTDVLY